MGRSPERRSVDKTEEGKQGTKQIDMSEVIINFPVHRTWFLNQSGNGLQHSFHGSLFRIHSSPAKVLKVANENARFELDGNKTTESKFKKEVCIYLFITYKCVVYWVILKGQSLCNVALLEVQTFCIKQDQITTVKRSRSSRIER